MNKRARIQPGSCCCRSWLEWPLLQSIAKQAVISLLEERFSSCNAFTTRRKWIIWPTLKKFQRPSKHHIVELHPRRLSQREMSLLAAAGCHAADMSGHVNDDLRTQIREARMMQTASHRKKVVSQSGRVNSVWTHPSSPAAAGAKRSPRRSHCSFYKICPILRNTILLRSRGRRSKLAWLTTTNDLNQWNVVKQTLVKKCQMSHEMGKKFIVNTFGFESFQFKCTSAAP